MGHGADHGHDHDHAHGDAGAHGHAEGGRGPAFEVQIERWEGHVVHALVDLKETVPAGGQSLTVVYEPRRRRIVAVRPWRNLGTFVLDELDRACGIGGGHH